MFLKFKLDKINKNKTLQNETIYFITNNITA